MAFQDPYRTLGLNPGASLDEIKKAYREMAKKYHPDHFSDPHAKELAEEKMAEINQAYDSLTQANSYSGTQSGSWNRGGQYRQSQNQNPWAGWQNPQGQSPYYRQSGGNRSCCNDLLCLCCADSICECLGADLVPCC